MDYIDKQIYHICKEITIENSILQNETMRHNRMYPQVLDYTELKDRFYEEYPELYDTMVEYYDNLEYFLMNEVNGVLVDNVFNMILTYGQYQERLSLKLPLSHIFTQMDEVLFIIIPEDRIKTVQGDHNNTKEPPLFIDCRLGTVTGYSVTENNEYYKKFKTLQKFYNKTKSKYGDEYLEAKRLLLAKNLFENYKSLLPQESIIQRQTGLIVKLNTMLEGIWPGKGYKIEPFGSSVTDLMIQGSDIDLSIVLPNDRQHIWKYKSNALRKPWGSVFNVDFIASQLELRGMEKIEAIHAIVPICKFQDPVTKLSCDLSVHNTLAIENSKLIKAYIKLDNRIRPLLYLIKYFTKMREINKSISGNLSSYSYVLLCLSYLMKVRPSPIVPNLQSIPVKCESSTCFYQETKRNEKRKFLYRGEIKKYDIAYHTCIEVKNEIRNILRENNQPSSSVPAFTTPYSSSGPSTNLKTEWKSYNSTDLATLLIDFFDFYSTLNFNQYIVAPSESGFIRRDKNNRRRKESIIIKDPFIEFRNVAATCTKIGLETVQKEFQRAYNMLTNGATFRAVCSRPNLDKRPYDPDSVENRKGNPQNNNNTNNSNQNTNNMNNELNNITKSVSTLNINSPNFYPSQHNGYNNTNTEFIGYAEEISDPEMANFNGAMNGDYNNNDSIYDEEEVEGEDYESSFYKDGFEEEYNDNFFYEDEFEDEEEYYNNDNDNSSVHISLKNVPEYIEEENIMTALWEHGFVVEMERVDTKILKKNIPYYGFYHWNITLSPYGASLPTFFIISDEAIYFDVLV